MKLPAFQFYPADWRKDPAVQSLSYHDRGIWFEILCLMHESEQRGKLLLNGSPMPEEALARLLGLDKQILTKALTTLLSYGVASRDEGSGALVNRRMVRDEELRKVRQAAGKLGGNPILLNQAANQTNDPALTKSQPLQSSSSSSVSTTKQKKETVAPASPERPRLVSKHETALSTLSDEERVVMQTWRDVCRTYPGIETWPTILGRIAKKFDVDRFKRCAGAYLTYYGKGQRYAGGVCDWYEENLTAPRGVNGRPPPFDPGRPSSVTFEPPTEEQLNEYERARAEVEGKVANISDRTYETQS